MQYTGLLPAFQDTQANHGEFIERYQRHTGARVATCWENQHLRYYCILRIYPETY